MTQTKQYKLEKNLNRYYLFTLLSTMNFMSPIFMLFLMDRGLTSTQIFLSQAVYTLGDLLLTVPCGSFADKVGRKKTLLLSSIFFAAAFAVYGSAHSFAQVVIGELLFAASAAAFHGVGEAFLYDTLAEGGHERRYKSILGSVYALQAVSLGGCAAFSGLLAKTDLSLPFFISVIPALLSLIPAFLLDEPKRVKEEGVSWLHSIKNAASYTLKHEQLRNIFVFVSVSGLTGLAGWMLYQPLFTQSGMKIEYLGIVMMLLSAAHAIGSKLAQKFEDLMGSIDFTLVVGVMMTSLYALIFAVSGIYIIIFAFIIDFIKGMSAPIVSEYINKHSGSHNRATILSLSTMTGSLTFSVFSPLLGLFVDAYSEQTAYILLAAIFGVYVLRQAGIIMLVSRAEKKVSGISDTAGPLIKSD